MSIYRSLCLLQSTPISSNKSPLPHQFTKFSNSLCTFTGLKLSVVMNKGMLFSTNAVSTEDFAVNVGEDLPQNYGDWFPEKDVKDKRRAGILLHPTSLHGNYEIGDLGDEVFKFLDWLHDSGCSVWQVLPLVPPGRKANEEGSPYSGQGCRQSEVRSCC